ncbi:hypothetical protein ABZV78_31765, partial [Micromonospora sp. NPDC004540]
RPAGREGRFWTAARIVLALVCLTLALHWVQRVPGASLPPAGPVAGAPADPATVRALVEAFQDGVRRAEDDAAPATPTPGRPRLSRRVPGANLAVSPVATAPPASPHPGDPAEVRDLITEFEAGVARALREVSPDRRYEEDPSR